MHDIDPAFVSESSLFARRASRRQLIGLDCLAAFGYLMVLFVFRSGMETTTPTWAMLGCAIAMAAPLAVRRLWPVPVFIVVLAASLVSLSISMPHDSFVAAGYALYTVALSAPDRRWIPTGVIAALTAVGALFTSMGGTVSMTKQTVGSLLVGVVVLGATWTLGRAVRDRRAHARHAARRLAEDLVAQEKLHIARELHDVVAHSMSLIAVKAAVANHVAVKHPQEAHHALAIIETTSKNALAEMRQILGVLRSDSDDSAASLAPAPGLADLPGLVDRAAMAGVKVTTDVTGVDTLPTGVDMSAYRIVQEAITNVVKHAAPAGCRVTIHGEAERLCIMVIDDGPGTRVLPGNPAGHGLIGMAERVAMYDGEFSAGPRAEGGFEVWVDIGFSPVEVAGPPPQITEAHR